jgi:hypothetical protein
MSPLLRNDFVEIGLSVPTESLLHWATDQVAATQGRESRLEVRGVDAPYIAALRDLIRSIGERKGLLGEVHDLPPKAVAHAERTRVEALGYWREVKILARTAFASEPDVLAKFRTGVETGLLILNLVREIESMVGLLREHAAVLSRFGANDAFIARGEFLVQRLRDAKVNVDAACRELPEAAAQLVHDKGLLYDLTRLLVRVGRLEFQRDHEQASRFSFAKVRRERGVSSGAQLNLSRKNG